MTVDDLEATVRILKDARARATFHMNGQLASIEFELASDVVIPPTGDVQDPIVGQRPKEPIRDIVLGEPPGLDLEASDFPDEPTEDAEARHDPGDGDPSGQGTDGTP